MLGFTLSLLFVGKTPTETLLGITLSIRDKGQGIRDKG